MPEVKYAKSGDAHVAYRIIGDGPMDIVSVPGLISHLDLDFEYTPSRSFLMKLASLGRLIAFDKRGTGLSDRTYNAVTLEEKMEDITAVMDDAGSRKALIYGESDGATLALLFAAVHPERTLGLVVFGGESKGSWAPDYPWEATKEQYNAMIESVGRDWGSEASIDRSISSLCPSAQGDPEFKEWLGRSFRSGVSPSAMVDLLKMNRDMDVRQVLPTIRVPTLVIHQSGDRNVRVENGRYIAQQVPGAKYVEIPGNDHVHYLSPEVGDRVIREMKELAGVIPQMGEHNVVLATIMFMDMVGSTEMLAGLGDLRWKELADETFRRVRSDLAKCRGREVKAMGDGMLVIFEGPTKAIKCAREIRDSLRTMGIPTRIGIHSGECILSGNDVQGLAVNIASRVVEKAKGDEILVSRTVKDLVAGSGISFREPVTYSLKGVPGMWELYSVSDT